VLSDLAWLQAPPEDVRAELKALRAAAAEMPDGFVERLLRLALTRLDEGQLAKLAAVARAITGAPAPLNRVRFGLIGDGTLSLFGPAITGSGLRHGLLIDIVEGSYGSALQEAADPSSPLHAERLDMALLALDHRLAGLDCAALSQEDARAKVEAAFGRIRMIVEGMRQSVTGPILVQTLTTPLEPLFGSFDRVEPGSVFSMVEALNRRLADWAREGPIVLVDIARLAASIGHERWDAPGHWHASKLSFAPEFIPVYADVVARTIGVIKGKAKKALVLDLDNTLWGGIIGDDGLEGIKLGQGSATGEAFVAIQRMALELRGRGIVLAVCSKNEDAVARRAFREHPDMLLREEHIAVFQANWSDKAANLKAIAETLNIGVDALVFLDDNPAERAQVRRELPLVGVPELPEDPALYPRMLAAAGYFDTVALSKEDRLRAELYQTNAARAELMASASDMDSYLRSLDMVCTIRRVDKLSRPRVAQLINKSNQFNLTTTRYSEAEVEALESDPSRHVVQLRLADRFGDNGIISVLIANKQGDSWKIGTWLMSCRVLGRRVQEAALAHLVAAARAEGAKRLIGTYLPTAKNMMVASHYAGLGFAPAGEVEHEGTRWELDLATYDAPDLPMKIVDEALTPSMEAA
jgi:FkbH-like protein